MVTQIGLATTVVVFLGYVGLSNQVGPGCWTNYFNQDTPRGSGDFETFRELRKKHPAEICVHPLRIQAVTTTGIPAERTGQKLAVYSIKEGLICLNKHQKYGGCLDYKVRFECLCPPVHCLSVC
ncbi:cartilage intermediate layer protein 1 [Kryptolebias marmoratus]|uniref:cartilage intermediate layer protein 1 n=1 Tax=Kryptolebias marmoratus TaxID=37003 RepID=UPI0007F8D7AE|nr:cartilage intermediate layer protein 1 [Kryptolebias marmoratus]